MKRLFPLTIVCACALCFAAVPQARAGDPDPTQPPGDWLRQPPIQLWTATLGWDAVTNELLAVGRAQGADLLTLWAWNDATDWRRLLTLDSETFVAWPQVSFDRARGCFYLLEGTWPTGALRVRALESRPTPHARWLGEEFAASRVPSGLFFDARAGRLIAATAPAHGSPADTLWAYSLADAGPWSVLRTIPPRDFRPYQERGIALALDASRGRLVWQKRYDWAQGTFVDSTLALPLDGDGGWTVLSAFAPPRSWPAGVVVDSLSDRLVMAFTPQWWPPAGYAIVAALDLSGVGGWSSMTDLDGAAGDVALAMGPDGQDLWAFPEPPNVQLQRLNRGAGSSWQVQNGVPVLPPSGFDRPALVADPFGRRLIEFTLPNSDAPTGDTRLGAWAAPMGSARGWALLDVAGTAPPLRFAPRVVVDPLRRRALLFGGRLVSGAHSAEVWALSLTGEPRWSRIETFGDGPAAREAAMCAFDPVQDRMIVMGGSPVTGSWGDDLWELRLQDVPRWRRLSVRGELPAGDPVEHRVVRDPGDGRLHVLPAIDGGPFVTLAPGDTATWTSTLNARPFFLHAYSCAAIHEPIGRRMIVNGGREHRQPFGTYLLCAAGFADTSTWSALAPTGESGPASFGHDATYDPIGDQMVVGGMPGDPSIWLLQWNRPERAAPWAIAADGEGVHLDWFAKGPAGLAFLVQRRTPTEPWTTLGARTASGEHVTWSDAAVRTGERYGYRLAWPSGTDTLWCEESWTYGPAATGAVALAGAWPNPSRGQAVTLVFTLADASAARLELFDITGRRVWSRATGGTVGRQLATINASLHPGVYLARVTQGVRRATARIVVVK